MNQPIQRHPALQPLSREHHQGLLLCFKIRKGLAAGVDPMRINNYTTWFYNEYLIPHFEIEEQFIFSLLPDDHDMVKTALDQHRNLHTLFNNKQATAASLKQLEKALEEHIRFEERILFNEIQKTCSKEQMQQVEKIHHEKAFCEKTDDPFWK